MLNNRLLPSAATTALLLSAALLTASCTSPVDTQDSGIAAPSLWSRLSGGDASVTPAKPDLSRPLVADPSAQVEHVWWRHFRDPTLDGLVSQALANNKTLQIAKARVEEAQANRGISRARLFPELSAAANASRGNQGFATNDKAVGLAGVDLEASWELDLFGRNQARTAEATAILQSEDASRQAVMVGLLSEVARTYFELRNSERQIALTQQNLITQKKTQELIEAQFTGAIASDFDVQRAKAQVSTTEAQVPLLQAARDAAANRLSVLLGAPPGSQDAMLAATTEWAPLDPHILVAAPATVLATRPDVKVAERRFAASLSAKEAATADLFPNISLTAFFGGQTATPFSSNPWGVGFALVQPILNFGRIESQIDAADARQKQAFLGYQQTVLEALENMENALSSYQRETTRNGSLSAAVQQNRKATELARQQYTNGYVGLLDVLVAERNLLDAESSQAASDASLRKNLVAIYAAAGGGWKE